MESKLTAQLLDKIDQYLKGSLNDTERAIFKEKISKDKELEEEVILQKQLLNTIHDKKWISIKNDPDNEELSKIKEQLNSKEYRDASSLIRKIGQATKETKKAPVRKLYYRYAIAIAAIFLIFFSVLFIKSSSELNTLYTDYTHWNKELPSFVEQSSATNSFSKGEIAFRNKNYKEALEHFMTIKKENQQYPYALMYIGAAQELLENNKEALQAFDDLIALKKNEEHTKGYWYKLLIYLKLDDKENAKNMVTMIINDQKNYNYAKALEIEKQLK